MKLTIIRLKHLSAQDRLDLTKIWPRADPAVVEKWLDQQHQVFAAKFNDRLLAAVRVRIDGDRGEMAAFMVREVTRRRGVGRYLLEEVLAQNPLVTQWWLADTDCSDRQAATKFMTAGGFVAQPGGWCWRQQ